VTTIINALFLVAHRATIILDFVGHQKSAEMIVWSIPNAKVLARFVNLVNAFLGIFVDLSVTVTEIAI